MESEHQDPFADVGPDDGPPPEDHHDPGGEVGPGTGLLRAGAFGSAVATTPGPAAHAPPHDAHAEEAVLGALMLSQSARYAVTVDDPLRADDFYSPQHRVVFEAIQRLEAQNQPIDSVTVGDQLRKAGEFETAGGAEAIWRLSAAVTDVAALPHHARIVQQLAWLRRLQQATYDIQAAIGRRDMEPALIVEEAQKRVFEVSNTDHAGGLRAVSETIDEQVRLLETLEKEGKDVTGLPTGFRDLDLATAGLQPGAFIVLAARPAMGKSALVTNLAENVALKGDGGAVALFSLEMPENELLQRIIASRAAIKGDDVRKGRIGDRWPDVLDVVEQLGPSPLFIDDSSDIGIMEVRAKARRLGASHPQGVSLVIVDYLQLMRADGRSDSRVQQVGEMSRGLKILAQELSCPVIALSQLSRAVESRPDKRPMLSDLRESGNIEQDADLVMFLYRDEYYNEETAEPGVAELIITKNRSGRLATIRLLFQKEYPRFLGMTSGGLDGPPARTSGPPMGGPPGGGPPVGGPPVGGPPLPGGGPPLPGR